MTLHILDGLEQEEWRAIPGHDGYEVSNLGQVRSYRAHGGKRRLDAPRMKAPQVHSAGYLKVSLQTGSGKCRPATVHTLVAAAFLGPRPDGYQVAHADGNKLNARLDNLRYATAVENAEDKRRHGTDTPGERNGRRKLTDDAVREIRRLRIQGALQRELAAKYGVSISAIQFVLNGQHWSHVKEDAA